jgi:hypothetical protein
MNITLNLSLKHAALSLRCTSSQTLLHALIHQILVEVSFSVGTLLGSKNVTVTKTDTHKHECLLSFFI